MEVPHLRMSEVASIEFSPRRASLPGQSRVYNASSLQASYDSPAACGWSKQREPRRRRRSAASLASSTWTLADELLDQRSLAGSPALSEFSAVQWPQATSPRRASFSSFRSCTPIPKSPASLLSMGEKNVTALSERRLFKEGSRPPSRSSPTCAGTSTPTPTNGRHTSHSQGRRKFDSWSKYGKRIESLMEKPPTGSDFKIAPTPPSLRIPVNEMRRRYSADAVPPPPFSSRGKLAYQVETPKPNSGDKVTSFPEFVAPKEIRQSKVPFGSSSPRSFQTPTPRPLSGDILCYEDVMSPRSASPRSSSVGRVRTPPPPFGSSSPMGHQVVTKRPTSGDNLGPDLPGAFSPRKTFHNDELYPPFGSSLPRTFSDPRSPSASSDVLTYIDVEVMDRSNDRWTRKGMLPPPKPAFGTTSRMCFQLEQPPPANESLGHVALEWPKPKPSPVPFGSSGRLAHQSPEPPKGSHQVPSRGTRARRLFSQHLRSRSEGLSPTGMWRGGPAPSLSVNPTAVTLHPRGPHHVPTVATDARHALPLHGPAP